jgi:hypothetical protein
MKEVRIMAAPKKAAKRPAKKAAQRPSKADSVRKVEDVDLPDATDNHGVEEDESYSDRLAEEADAPEKPDGSPAMVPFIALARRERAKAMRLLAKLRGSAGALEAHHGDRLAALQKAADEGIELDDMDDGAFEAGADMIEMAADVEEVLLVCAEDPDEFRLWAKAATDNAVLDLFGWYSHSFRMGEATASPS